MTNKLLIITRCSRIANLKQIATSIHEVMNGSSYLWTIIFDCNKVTPPAAIRTDIVSIVGIENVVFEYSASNQKYYGSNLANEVLNNDTYCTHAYLLDDDNKLHKGIRKIFESVESKIQFFSQLRFNRDLLKVIPVSIDNTISKDNCIGWVDSAQFIIPIDVLRSIGGYADGYYIDGKTIQTLLEKEIPFECYKDVAAYYNYFTEMKDLGH